MQLNSNHLKSAEYVRNIFFATPEAGTTYADMLTPEYWSHVAAQLQPNSRIEVVSEDLTWFAELMVTSVGRNWATVTPLRFVELAEAAAKPAPSAKHVVKWRGANHKHSVVRAADKVVVKEGFATAKDAEEWLAQHEVQSLV